MSNLPERFEVPPAQRYASAGLAFVMLGIAAVGGWFALNGNPGSKDPAADHFAFLAMATFFALIAVIIAAEARRVWRSAITLRDGGVELERGDDTPTFIGWGQIGGLKFRSAAGGTAVLGLGGDRLFTVDSRLVGVGRLLHAILVNAVLPKRSPVLPYRTEQSISRLVPVAVVIAFATGAFALVSNTPADARPQVLVAVAVIVAIIGGVVTLAARFGSAGAVVVDADGITSGRAGTRRPWNTVQGAALAFVRGPKGQLYPRVALQGTDGAWTPIFLPGTDLVELLAAINAAAPGKIIAPPDQPLGMAGRVNVTFKVNKTFRVGPPKSGGADPQ